MYTFTSLFEEDCISKIMYIIIWRGSLEVISEIEMSIKWRSGLKSNTPKKDFLSSPNGSRTRDLPDQIPVGML